MKKMCINLDPEVLAEARAACGAASDAATVRQGLQALVQRAAGERLIALFGSEPDARDVPRRRESMVGAGPSAAPPRAPLARGARSGRGTGR